MSVEASIFLRSLDGLLSYFQKDRHRRHETEQVALLAMNAALTATDQYIELSKGVKGFDRAAELSLASLWREAAIRVKVLNQHCVGRFSDKADYWVSRIEWDREDIFDKAIDLSSIRKEIARLIEG